MGRSPIPLRFGRDHTRFGQMEAASGEQDSDTLLEHSCDHKHEKKPLIYALVLTLVFTAAELVAALVANSLVLAMDAVHHFVDVAAIVVALVALELSDRPTSTILSRTFTDKDGYQHFFAELVASLANAALLVIMTSLLMIEAVVRLSSHEKEDVNAVIIIVLASVSCVVNLVKIWLLHQDAMNSLNVRAIYVHVLADMFGSVGTLGAGIWLLNDPNNTKVEPILALVIGAVILINALWVIVPGIQLVAQGSDSKENDSNPSHSEIAKGEVQEEAPVEEVNAISNEEESNPVAKNENASQDSTAAPTNVENIAVVEDGHPG